MNYVKSNTGLWYALPDLVASKLLTGKTPIIEEAITFRARGIQPDLRSIEVLKGVRLSPEEDFIKKLIEERIRLKKKMKTANKDEVRQLDLKQGILKIIANSTSYGIFIQIDREDSEEQKVDVYGIDQFKVTINKVETPGSAFNPIMAVAITSSTRLILATAEALIAQNGGKFAYCDTDSIFVSPEQVKTLQEFFRPLNPYSVEGLEMFKVETDEEGRPLDNVIFYGISAKRYALYDYDPTSSKIIIRKYSSHGLGHLQNIDEKAVWKDILTIRYHPAITDEIMRGYAGKYAVSQLTITKPDILARFNKLNERKPYHKRIKPFNFITVGMGYRLKPDTKKPIIPMTPYISPKDRRYQELPYNPFIDYRTGEQYPNGTMDTRYYWKPLSEVISDYMEHPEFKSEGDIGLLKRRYVRIGEDSIHYIGKESNQLEESETIGVESDNYTTYEDPRSLNNKILAMKEKDAWKLGMSPRSLYYWKAKIREGKKGVRSWRQGKN